MASPETAALMRIRWLVNLRDPLPRDELVREVSVAAQQGLGFGRPDRDVSGRY